jgi:hypothetical protein
VALSEVYVDPSIAADSGTGTIGDPYGDLDYAIVQDVFDTTWGTRYNVKAGTTEVMTRELSAILADATGGGAKTPSQVTPCIIAGYTAVEGDGGMCSISGGGTTSFNNSASTNGIALVDCHLHSCGNRTAATLGAYTMFLRCWIECEGTSAIGVFGSTYSKMHQCYVVSTVVRTTAEMIQIAGYVSDSYMDNSLSTNGGSCTADYAEKNIVLAGTANGLRISLGGVANLNSVYGTGGAARNGIYNTGNRIHSIWGNLVEGFSGAGSFGIRVNNTQAAMYGANAVYNCTTPYAVDGIYGDIMLALGDNETLTASPFNDAANGDFSPVDVGSVIEGALPQVIGGGFV